MPLPLEVCRIPCIAAQSVKAKRARLGHLVELSVFCLERGLDARIRSNILQFFRNKVLRFQDPNLAATDPGHPLANCLGL